MPEKLRYECPKCGKTGEFENWEGSPYSAEDQPVRMTCGTCAIWKNYETTGGKVKGQVFVVTQQY
jgi:hypothetical protein